MSKVSHKPFEEWKAKQNPRNRVQPVTGTRLKNNQIILQVYGTTTGEPMATTEGNVYT